MSYGPSSVNAFEEQIDTTQIRVAEGKEAQLATDLGIQGFMISQVREGAMTILIKYLDDEKEIANLNNTLSQFGAKIDVQPGKTKFTD